MHTQYEGRAVNVVLLSLHLLATDAYLCSNVHRTLFLPSNWLTPGDKS